MTRLELLHAKALSVICSSKSLLKAGVDEVLRSALETLRTLASNL